MEKEESFSVHRTFQRLNVATRPKLIEYSREFDELTTVTHHSITRSRSEHRVKMTEAEGDLFSSF